MAFSESGLALGRVGVFDLGVLSDRGGLGDRARGKGKGGDGDTEGTPRELGSSFEPGMKSRGDVMTDSAAVVAGGGDSIMGDSFGISFFGAAGAAEK